VIYFGFSELIFGAIRMGIDFSFFKSFLSYFYQEYAWRWP